MSITVPRGVGGSQAATIADFERRREIVRHFFNDFWTSTDDNPRTFAERLNRAEDHINERLAARAEGWQLDATTRKQLGLPPPRTVLDLAERYSNGVKVCQRQLVNEVLGPLVTEFARNLGREGATPI
jgi:hypothetical protein